MSISSDWYKQSFFLLLIHQLINKHTFLYIYTGTAFDKLEVVGYTRESGGEAAALQQLGVRTRVDTTIHFGEVVASIPQSCLIRSSLIMETKIGKRIMSHVTGGSDSDSSKAGAPTSGSVSLSSTGASSTGAIPEDLAVGTGKVGGGVVVAADDGSVIISKSSSGVGGEKGKVSGVSGEKGKSSGEDELAFGYGHLKLVLFILLDMKDSKSASQSYYNLLPKWKSLQEFPLFWHYSSLSAVGGASVVDKTGGSRSSRNCLEKLAVGSTFSNKVRIVVSRGYAEYK